MSIDYDSKLTIFIVIIWSLCISFMVFIIGLSYADSTWKNYLIEEGHGKYELVSPESDTVEFKLIPMTQPADK
jgi:hypothetical protein